MIFNNFGDALVKTACIHIPLMNAYHSLKDNVFLNTKVEDANPLEAAGNFFLTPARYLLNGRRISNINVTEKSCNMTLDCDYKNDGFKKELFKTILSIISLPISLIIGSALKGLSYISATTRENHRVIAQEISCPKFTAQTVEYANMGINQVFTNETAACQNVPFPEPTDYQKALMQSAYDIISKLEEFKIPSWVEYGTHLATYRHGSIIPWDWDVDVGILEVDHKNAKHALSQLDPEKYSIQDWSSAHKPETYLRVLIKGHNTYVDLYHFEAKDGNVRYQYTYESSPLIPNSMKERELRCINKVRKVEDLFPLKTAKFGSNQVRVPNNSVACLQTQYGDIRPCKVWDEQKNDYVDIAGHDYFKDGNAY